jgi:hypothetical protein
MVARAVDMDHGRRGSWTGSRTIGMGSRGMGYGRGMHRAGRQSSPAYRKRGLLKNLGSAG